MQREGRRHNSDGALMEISGMAPRSSHCCHFGSSWTATSRCRGTCLFLSAGGAGDVADPFGCGARAAGRAHRPARARRGQFIDRLHPRIIPTFGFGLYAISIVCLRS